MNDTSKTKSRIFWYGWFVSGLAALFYTYEYLLRIEPSVMVPQLMRNFGVEAAGLGILAAMYYYAYTPLQIVVGVLTDYFGPKRVLTIAIAFCALGSWIFGSTGNVYWGGVGRLLIGMGSAFAFVGVLKLAAMWLPRKRFAFFVGFTTSLGMLGALIGDVEMSWLVTTYSWHRVLIMSAIFGFILIPVFFFFVHEKRTGTDGKHHITAGLKEAFIGFWRMITNRQIIYAGLIGCMLYLSLSVFAEMWGIPFIHSVTLGGRVHDAKINSMVFLGWLIGAPLSGWLSDKLRSRRLPLIVGSLLAAMTIGVVLIWPQNNHIILGFLLFLFGLFSSVEVISFAIGRDSTDVSLTATTMGVINFLIMLGGMILQPFAAWVLSLVWSGKVSDGLHVYSFSDYRSALIIIPIAMLSAAVLSFFLKETYKANVE